MTIASLLENTLQAAERLDTTVDFAVKFFSR
jgi:5,10-methylene-tetrahydrofolate dehydrogenase/methenyl tetrahydrofolate cyclohydrolase